MKSAFAKPRSFSRRPLFGMAMCLGTILVALAASCEKDSPVAVSNIGGGSADAGANVASTTSSLPQSTTSGNYGGSPPEAPPYDPALTEWVPVTWSSPCTVEMAIQPTLGAPPLYWVPCGTDAPGCEQQFEQPLLDTNAQRSKASVVAWGSSGYRIGMTESFVDGGHIAAIYDTDGTAMVAWKVTSNPPVICKPNRPIVTEARVWFGVIAVNPDASAETVVIAPTWSELTTVTTTYEFNYFYQVWFASSDVMLGWVADGITLHLRDLVKGKEWLFGNGFLGNPHYAYPHVVGTSAIALTAPDGFPDLTVWDRSTEVFTDLMNPTPPMRVADANSDGETLVWVVNPDPDAPGELWTSPMTSTLAAFEPTYRRPTPPIKGTGSAAGGGFYAVYSHSEKLLPEGGPGDGAVHIYRLSDAHHWKFEVPATSYPAMWIYHVDEDYVFYSGYGSLIRQRRDVLGPGDPAP